MNIFVFEIVVSPGTAEDLNETGNDDEETKSKNSTSVVKHHLKKDAIEKN